MFYTANYRVRARELAQGRKSVAIKLQTSAAFRVTLTHFGWNQLSQLNKRKQYLVIM